MHKDLIEIKKDILNYIPIIYKEYDVDLRLVKYLVENIDNIQLISKHLYN